jgi:hypothetical protein
VPHSKYVGKLRALQRLPLSNMTARVDRYHCRVLDNGGRHHRWDHSVGLDGVTHALDRVSVTVCGALCANRGRICAVWVVGWE